MPPPPPTLVNRPHSPISGKQPDHPFHLTPATEVLHIAEVAASTDFSTTLPELVSDCLGIKPDRLIVMHFGGTWMPVLGAFATFTAVSKPFGCDTRRSMRTTAESSLAPRSDQA